MKNTKLFWLVIMASVFFLLFPPRVANCQGRDTLESHEKAQKSTCRTYPVAPMPAMHYGLFLMDRLEYTFTGKNKKAFSYEATGWYGGDYQRLWLEAEGDHDSGSSKGGEVERLDLLYGRLLTPFWNIRAGMGYMGTYGPDSDERFFGVIGIKGLAPYMFEIDTNIKLSSRSELLWDFESEYDIYLSQRLVFQPRFDATFSFNKIAAMTIGPGFSNLSFSARLRYEISREFAPYIGISWETSTGGSRKLARKERTPRDITRFFAGLRFWF